MSSPRPSKDRPLAAPPLLSHLREIDWSEMKRALVSKHDFEEDLRLDGKTEDVSAIHLARLERSSDISVIKKKQ